MNGSTSAERSSFESLEPRRLLAATLIKDIGEGELHANPSELTRVGNTLYFVAAARAEQATAGSFWELWRTDGTAAGTERITHIEGTTPGDTNSWNSTSPGLSFFFGPRGLVVSGDSLWYYDIGHSSSQILRVAISRVGPDGQVTRWELGTMNLSTGQRPHDIQNVDGKIYFYRDADPYSLDPSLRRSTWWTIDTEGNLASTGSGSTRAFLGQGPAYAKSIIDGSQRYYVHDDGTHGRELWRGDNPYLSRGILRIYGSDADDDILVYRRPSNPDRLIVMVNGHASSFRFSSITRIQGDLFDGNDRLLISESGGVIGTPVSVHGGAGNDTIQTASGRDTIYGGPGDDALYGGNGIDYLFGEGGKDRLVGGGGRDVLYGGDDQNTFVRSSSFERRDYKSLEDLLV
jgi:ELWxxDGT repeat protein